MAKKETTKETKTTGYSAAQLAEEFEITPAILRQHLRALKIEKPEGGWNWPKKTDEGLVEIRKAVKQRLKDLAAKAAGKEEKPAKEEKPTKTEEKTEKKGKKKTKAE